MSAKCLKDLDNTAYIALPYYNGGAQNHAKTLAEKSTGTARTYTTASITAYGCLVLRLEDPKGCHLLIDKKTEYVDKANRV